MLTEFSEFTEVADCRPLSTRRRRKRLVRRRLRPAAQHVESVETTEITCEEPEDPAEARRWRIDVLFSCVIIRQILDADMRARFLASPHREAKEMATLYSPAEAIAASNVMAATSAIRPDEMDAARMAVADFIRRFVPRQQQQPQKG